MQFRFMVAELSGIYVKGRTCTNNSMYVVLIVSCTRDFKTEQYAPASFTLEKNPCINKNFWWFYFFYFALVAEKFEKLFTMKLLGIFSWQHTWLLFL